MSTQPIGEKERVYRELERVQRKCAALRREVKELRAKEGAKEAAVLRKEATEYRKALSNILYRLNNDGGVGPDDLRRIVHAALLLRGLKAHQREAVRKVYPPDHVRGGETR